MALDTISIQCIVDELNKTITGGRIEKVYQPEKDEITLNIRTFSDSYRLTISASPTNPRIHFSTASKENPSTPPMFCMLMRKHISSGKIVKITNSKDDRIVTFCIESYDELGDLTTKYLIVEIMGRYSNIILTKSDMTIIDSVKHIDFTISSVREILPGRVYTAPPLQDKTPVLSDDLKVLVLTPPEIPQKTDKFILSKISGISPLTAREITYRAFNTCDITTDSSDFNKLNEVIKAFDFTNFKPCMIIEKESGRVLDFSAIDILQYEDLANVIYYESMSELLENFYKTKDSKERMKQKSADIIKVLNNNISKLSKKIVILKSTLDDAKNKDRHKKYGDLLMANLYNIKAGDTLANVSDYFSPKMETIKIPLLPELSPSANAQRYYKLYNKAKKAETEVSVQISSAQDDLLYLESTLSCLENCTTEAELNEIRLELSTMGYIKSQKSKKKQTVPASKPHHYISSDGFDIYVGKNNMQNDKLTLKFANSSDIWFHTKNIHGSHVIIKLGVNKDVPDKTITEAAQLAAYYSKARESSRVPVDYTFVKNVKKPNGAKPGMVIYDFYNTIYVNPELINQEEK